MHSSISPHGGDLKHDTVAIIGRFDGFFFPPT